MTQTLMRTAAVAALIAAATPIHAAEWDIRLGGYMEQFIGYVNNDTVPTQDYSGVHSLSDQEFYVRPQITLDNGIRISVRMDFEGANNGGVDEPRMIISGSFGSLTLGEDDDAAADTMKSAVEVDTLGINSGSEVDFLPGNLLVPQDGASRGADPNIGNDAMGIKYFTPRVFGLQLGASYSRDSNRSGNKALNDTAADGAVSDTISVGATLVDTYGPVGVNLGAGWSTQTIANTAGPDIEPQIWHVGGWVEYEGFSLGGSFAQIMENGAANEGQSYILGVAYETGPWGVSFTYLHGENGNDTNAALFGDDEVDEYKLAIAYDLARGVKLQAFGIYVNEDDASSNATFSDATGAGVGDLTSWIIGTGIRADF